jgi:predicted ribosomally synthesized peptide with SipW-like signal peptide
MVTIRKVIGLGIAGLIVLSLAVGATWAYLTDSETSTSNQVTAGTLDLKTNDADGVTQSIYAPALKPGSSIGDPVNPIITLKNTGSHSALTMDISFSYTESDSSPNPGTNKTADEVATILEVTTLDYDWSSILSQINDVNSNGYKDLYDLTNDPLAGLAGLNPSASVDFNLVLRMRTGISNDFRGDGVNITMTFLLNQ